MHNETIITMLNDLPEEFKQEVFNFVEYLTLKYQKQNTEKSRKVSKFGSCKGLFIVPDDFDEPLEDFKEYM
jgi:hypothetical protein